MQPWDRHREHCMYASSEHPHVSLGVTPLLQAGNACMQRQKRCAHLCGGRGPWQGSPTATHRSLPLGRASAHMHAGQRLNHDTVRALREPASPEAAKVPLWRRPHQDLHHDIVPNGMQVGQPRCELLSKCRARECLAPQLAQRVGEAPAMQILPVSAAPAYSSSDRYVPAHSLRLQWHRHLGPAYAAATCKLCISHVGCLHRAT